MSRANWVVGGVVGVGFVLTTVLVLRCQKEKVLAAAGRPQSSTIADGAVILVDEITFERTDRRNRLVAVDARTGKKLATRVENELGITCATEGERAWCRFAGSPRGLDARTLGDRAHPGAVPELPSLITPVSCPKVSVGGDEIAATGTTIARPGKWSLPLAGSCQALAVVEDLVVVAVSGNPRAFGIDAASGAVRWSFTF